MNPRRPAFSFAPVALRASLLALGLVPIAALALHAQPAAAPTPQAAAVSRAAGRCGVCHPAERVAFERSVHAREDVHCVSCHGGNDSSLEIPVAHGGGFRGRPARETIPTLCASCHADEQKMRAYNLPVDQYALYQTSGHGQRLKAGDRRVAVCSDCHGAHDVLPPNDPASRVFTTNIPRTCGACHGDSALVRERKIRNVYQDYLTSVHAQQLFDKGNLRAATCVSCHGVHGAAPPEVGDVNKVCGQCHAAERRYFLAGPHKQGMDRQQLAECSSCHGDHAIHEARPEKLATVCRDCHGEGSPQVAIGGKLLSDYRSATTVVEKAETAIMRADAVPIQTDDYRARIAEARTYLSEALTTAHAVDPEVMSSFTLRAQSVGSEIQSDINGKLGNIRTSKLLLILFWFYVIVTAGILRRIRNRAARKS